MGKTLNLIKELLLDLFFPLVCLNCRKEGSYLCQDCLALIDVLEIQYCPFCQAPKITPTGKTCKKCQRDKTLNGLFAATSLKNPLARKMINQFKYEPFVKSLAQPLASLIIAHFQILGKSPTFLKKTKNQFLLIPLPLEKSKLKQIGFNGAEEIAEELSQVLKIPSINNLLFKTKETDKNIKETFLIKNSGKIENKKILLVNDLFTTGAPMEECAKLLKKAGAKEIWGVVAARE